MSSKNSKVLSIKWIQDRKKDFPFYWSEDQKYYIRLLSVRNWGVHVLAPHSDEQFYLGSRLSLRDAKKMVVEIENAVDPQKVIKDLIQANSFVIDAVKPEILERFDKCFPKELVMEMTAKEKAMEILTNAGCTVETYQGEPVDLILKDLKMGFPDGIEGGFKHEEIAEAIYTISTTDRGWKKQVLFEIDGDAAHCDVTDLYDDVAEDLRKLVASGEPFKTCWLNSKKELDSWQMERSLVGGEISVTVRQEMDEGTDLVYDALPDDVELTDAQMEEILDTWILGCDGRSEASETRVIPGDSSLDDILEVVSELVDECDETLTELYELMKGTVQEYLDLKGDTGDDFCLSARQEHVNVSLDDKIQSASTRVVDSHSSNKKLAPGR